MNRLFLKFLFLYFDFLRWLNDYDPTHKESRWAAKQDVNLTDREMRWLGWHACGASLELIATGPFEQVTRERVRQVIMKAQRKVRTGCYLKA